MKNIILRGLLTAVLAVATTSLWADDGEPCVVVEQTDGTRTEYLLADQPRVSFDGTQVRLVSNKDNVELAVADVAKVYLSEATPTAVTQGEHRPMRVAITADGIDLSGLEAGNTVTASTVGGQLLSTGKASADGSLHLQLSRQTGSVIVVKTSKRSFKLIWK